MTANLILQISTSVVTFFAVLSVYYCFRTKHYANKLKLREERKQSEEFKAAKKWQKELKQFIYAFNNATPPVGSGDVRKIGSVGIFSLDSFYKGGAYIFWDPTKNWFVQILFEGTYFDSRNAYYYQVPQLTTLVKVKEVDTGKEITIENSPFSKFNVIEDFGKRDMEKMRIEIATLINTIDSIPMTRIDHTHCEKVHKIVYKGDDQ